MLTDGAQAAAAGHDLGELLVRIVEAGTRGIVIRERHLPPAERRDVVGAAESLMAAAGGGLIVVASPPLHPRDNVHLTASDPTPAVRPRVVGRSCHGPGELRAAALDGCDYATLSPIFPTLSKPGYGPALGVEALQGAPLPVYALGGVVAGNAERCLAAGAFGVAVMGSVMRAADPERAVRELRLAVDGDDPGTGG